MPFFDEDEKYQTGRRAEELPDDPLVSGAWPREPGLLAPPTRHGVGGMTSVSGIEKCGHMPGSFEERAVSDSRVRSCRACLRASCCCSKVCLRHRCSQTLACANSAAASASSLSAKVVGWRGYSSAAVLAAGEP